MKKIFLILLLTKISISFSQTLKNGDCFTLFFTHFEWKYEDSIHHLKYNDGYYQLFDKDSNLVFKEKFTEYFKGTNQFMFWLAQNETQRFVVNPQSKNIVVLNKKLEPYYDFNNVEVLFAPYSKDTIIKLNHNLYLNLKGDVIFSGDSYFDDSYKSVLLGDKIKKEKIKGKLLKTEMDLFFEDDGYFNELNPEDYDESIKENLIYRELKNKFFDGNEFQDIQVFDFYNEMTFDERLYAAKKNNKWGLISTIGKVIIPFEYDRILFNYEDDFYNSTFNPRIYCVKGKTTFVFLTTGKLMFQRNNFKPSEYFNPEYYFNSPEFDGYVIRNKKKLGLLSSNGVEIVPPIYDNYDVLSLKNVEIFKEQQNINQNVDCFTYPYENYYIGINRKTRMNDFYLPNGKFLNGFTFDGISSVNKNGYFVFDFQGNYGLAGPSACIIEKPEYRFIELFEGAKDIFIIENDSLSYLIDGKGNQLYDQKFQYVQFVDTSYLAIAMKIDNNKVGLLNFRNPDNKLNWKLNPEFEDLVDLSTTIDSKQVFLAQKNNKYGIIDEDNKVYVDFKYDKILAEKNYQPVTVLNKKYGIIDYANRPILENKYDSIFKLENVIYLIKSENKLAIFDVYNKKFKTEFEYDKVKYIRFKNEFYIVEKNGKVGLLDSNFKKLMDCKYKEIKFDYKSDEFECIIDEKNKDCFFTKDLK